MRICKTVIELASMGDTRAQRMLQRYEQGDTWHFTARTGDRSHLHTRFPEPRRRMDDVTHASDCSLTAFRWKNK